MDRHELLRQMMAQEPDCTIRDFLDVLEGKRVFVPLEPEAAPMYMIENEVVIKKAACQSSVIILEPVRDKISTIKMAKKIGFAAGLKPGTVYGQEKAKWMFEIGNKCWNLQNAFREAYKEGKQYFNDVINGTNG